MLTATKSAVVVASSVLTPHNTIKICSIFVSCHQLNNYCRHQSTRRGPSDKIIGDVHVPKASDESIGRAAKARPKIDRSKVPSLSEKDLEENFISGSGPGGQNVNKAINCAQVRHNPSGIVVKVHQSRSLDKNREIARELIIEKLDNLYNGEASVANQKKRLARQRLAARDNQSEKRRALKEQYKKIFSQSDCNKGGEQM